MMRRGEGVPLIAAICAVPLLCEALSSALFTLPEVEGFRTVSAKLPYHMNLVVFPSKLLKGSRITYQDPATGKSHTLKG